MEGLGKRTIFWASFQTVRIMQVGRNIVYQYTEEDILSDEIEIDLTGELHFTKGEIIVRGGRNWKVNSIMIQNPIEKKERPTLWLELVYAPVN